MNELFYEVIQVAIGSRSKLSWIPSSNEWVALYDWSGKQAMVGICFYGIQKIYREQPEQIVNFPIGLRLQWLGITANLQNQNYILNKRCAEIQQQFKDAGLNTSILKGQGIASYYDSDISAFRQSGDIDIWVDGSWQDVMNYVNVRTPNREFDMKHTHLNVFSDTIVEVHWWPSMPINPFYSKALKSYYQEQVQIQCSHLVILQDGTKITAPNAKFQAVHVLYHIFNHFLYEGIGLRQMMDLYCVLVNGGLNDCDREEIRQTYHRVGLSLIVPASMWVLCHVFGMDNRFCIGHKDEKLGRVLLSEIEDGGNFGAYNIKNKVQNESFVQRMKRRLIRRIRLVRYNSIGLIFSPIIKLRIILWKRKVMKMYKL